MAVDREFRIRVIADATSLNESSKEATANVEKLGEKTGEAGKQIKFFSTEGKDAHKLMHLMSEMAPGLGLALRAAFHPQNIGIAALVTFIKMATSAIEEYEDRLKEISEKAAKPFMDMTGIIENSIDAVHRAMQAHAEWAQHVQEDAKKINTALELNLTKMKAEAAEIKKLAGDGTSVDSTERHAEINLIESALRQTQDALAKARAREAQIPISGRDPEKLKKQAEADRAEAEELRKKAAAKQAEGEIGFFRELGYQVLNVISLGGYFGLEGTGNRARRNRMSSADEESTRLIAEANKKAAQASHVSDLAAQATADQNSRTNQREEAKANVDALKAQVEGLQNRLAALRATSGIADVGDVMGGRPIQDRITQTLVRGAHALGQSQPSSEDRQAAAALGQMLAALHQNLPALVQTIRQHSNDIQYLMELSAQLRQIADSYKRSGNLNHGG